MSPLPTQSSALSPQHSSPTPPAAPDDLLQQIDRTRQHLAEILGPAASADPSQPLSHLNSLQAQRLAHHYLPLALATLLELTTNKDPHLARRATRTLLQSLTP